MSNYKENTTNIDKIVDLSRKDRNTSLSATRPNVPMKELPVDVDNLRLRLADLQSRYDPTDNANFIRQNAMANEIQRLKKLVNLSSNKGTFEDMTESINKTLIQRIAEGLVRVEDILEDNQVYGGIGEGDRKAIKDAFYNAMERGWRYDDIIDSLVERCKLEGSLKETTIGVVSPATSIPTAPKPVGTSTQTPNAISQVAPAANINIGGQQITKPTTQQDLDNLTKSLEKTMKDPNFNKDFSTLLAKVMQKGM